jgi:hypothetical protein
MIFIRNIETPVSNPSGNQTSPNDIAVDSSGDVYLNFNMEFDTVASSTAQGKPRALLAWCRRRRIPSFRRTAQQGLWRLMP